MPRSSPTAAPPPHPTAGVTGDVALPDTQLLKGVLPMLVLALLRSEESYGYALVVRLQEAGLDDIATGTVYPVLTRLEREGNLSARLVPSASGPARKYYSPTARGLATLAAHRRQWDRLAAIVASSTQTAPPVPPAPGRPETTEET